MADPEPMTLAPRCTAICGNGGDFMVYSDIKVFILESPEYFISG